jgi:hypothetical protein
MRHRSSASQGSSPARSAGGGYGSATAAGVWTAPVACEVSPNQTSLPAAGEIRPAQVPANGRIRHLRRARVTHDRTSMDAVVCVHSADSFCQAATSAAPIASILATCRDQAG